MLGDWIKPRGARHGYQLPNYRNRFIDNDANSTVLQRFFEGVASCDYYDGRSYQLYLDLDDNSLIEHMEASDQSWLQRDDNSLIQVLTVNGYADTPEGERYNKERGDDIMDFGYAEWLDYVEERINEANRNARY